MTSLVGTETPELIGNKIPDQPMVDVFFQFWQDENGQPRPLWTYKMINGRERRVKQVKQPDGTTFKEYYQKDDAEWAPLETDEPCNWVVRGIGSSNITDMDGDTLHPPALKCMTDVILPFNTYIAHQKDDDHLLGGLIEIPILTVRNPDGRGLIKAQEQYAAIEIASDIETDNWQAVRAFKYMSKGRRFGWSAGMYYTDWKPKTVQGRKKGADVFGLLLDEFSSTPCPSNQQSWIESTHKSMIRKGWLPAEDLTEGETLYRLSKEHCDDFGPVIGPRMEALRQHMESAGIILSTEMPRPLQRSA